MKKFKQWMLSSFLIVIIYEAFETGIKELLAWLLTQAIASSFSILFTVSLTASVQFAIKRLLKTTIVEKGEKMKILKSIATFLWGNKLTGTLVGASTFAGYAVYILEPTGYETYNIVVGLASAILFSFVSVRIGGEKLTAIVARLAETKLSKEQLAKAKEAEAKILEIAKRLEEENRARLLEEAKQIALKEAENEKQVKD